MRRLLTTLAIAIAMAVGLALPAAANPPRPACNGLNQAHTKIHASGTQGELQLHDLRMASHCGH